MTRNRIARLETDGRLDQTLNLSTSSGSQRFRHRRAAGRQDSYRRQFHQRLGRAAQQHGAIEHGRHARHCFQPERELTSVYAIAVQADGKILVGGDFTSIGGQTRNGIARLDATTGLADSFNPNANDMVFSIAVQADGKILVGGSFTERTASAGRRATASPGSIPPPAWLIRSTRTRTASVFSIAVQADGKILVGGFFTSIGGQTRNRIARLDADDRLG